MAATETERSYGELLRDYRARLRLSQDDLAAAAGVDVKTVRNHEHGEGAPQERVVAQLAAALEARGKGKGLAPEEIDALRAAALRVGPGPRVQEADTPERPATSEPPQQSAGGPDAPAPQPGRPGPQEPDSSSRRSAPRRRRGVLLSAAILVAVVAASISVLVVRLRSEVPSLARSRQRLRASKGRS